MRSAAIFDLGFFKFSDNFGVAYRSKNLFKYKDFNEGV